MTSKTQFPKAQKHGPIEEIFPNVFFVAGSMRMGFAMRINRNMVIVRDGQDLTLVNPIRLSPKGEDELNKLGTVKHVIRLGCFHGLDDAYCVDRFDATFWCQENSDHYADPPVQEVLQEGGALPIPNAHLFAFQLVKKPEAALLLKDCGLLITCDSLQNYENKSGMSLLAGIMMSFLGFTMDTLIGPMWLKFQTPEGGSLEPDYRRLLELDFQHLVSAHGQLRRDTAKAGVTDAVNKVFG